MVSVWPTTHDVMLSALRWMVGLSLGTLLGLLIAGVEGRLSTSHAGGFSGARLLLGFFDYLRALPIIALVPVVQTVGVGEHLKMGLIAWAVMFPVWIAVRQARNEPMVDLELALSGAGLDRSRIVRIYEIPKALRGMLRGVEISIGVGWLSVVAAEWIGTYSDGFWSGGLGYKIVVAHDANSWLGMLACLALFGALGTASAWGWRRLLSLMKAQRSGFSPLSGYGAQ